MPTYGKGCSVSAAATSGMTVPANSYVVATYTPNSPPSGGTVVTGVHIAYFGPGQTVYATLTAATSGFGATTVAFAAGVVFTNS